MREKALDRKNILVTRPQEQAFEFAARLIEEGANIYLLPTVRIAPPEDFTAIDEVLSRIGNYDWITFTSINGIKYFFERFNALGIDRQLLSGIKIAAVGPATAKAAEAEGLTVGFIPEHHTSEGLGKEIEDIEGARFLIPTTDISNHHLQAILDNRGALVDEVAFYLTRKNEVAREYIRQVFDSGIDVITFTSSSSVQSLTELAETAGIDLRNYMIACIGPSTAESVREHGLQVDVIASPFTTEGLIAEIINYYHNEEIKEA